MLSPSTSGQGNRDEARSEQACRLWQGVEQHRVQLAVASADANNLTKIVHAVDTHEDFPGHRSVKLLEVIKRAVAVNERSNRPTAPAAIAIRLADDIAPRIDVNRSAFVSALR